MDTIYENFKKYLILQDKFIKTKLGKLKFTCDCGDEITINGATSHRVKCDKAYTSKYKFLNEYFDAQDTCIFCGKKLNKFDGKTRLDASKIYFCSPKCIHEASSFVKRYEKHKTCVVCGKHHIRYSDTCSLECSKKIVSDKVKSWHKNSKNEAFYIDRNRKISEKATKRKVNIWNKGLSGKEYLNHYEKNGKNKLLEQLKKNGWYKKTSPEIKFEQLLIKLKLDYKYSPFIKRLQFDFIIPSLKLVIEIDGDYFHRSSKKCNDPQERARKREEDINKAKIPEKYGYRVIRFWEFCINNEMDKVEEIFKSEIQTNSGEWKNYYEKHE